LEEEKKGKKKGLLNFLISSSRKERVENRSQRDRKEKKKEGGETSSLGLLPSLLRSERGKEERGGVKKVRERERGIEEAGAHGRCSRRHPIDLFMRQTKGGGKGKSRRGGGKEVGRKKKDKSGPRGTS